MFGTSDQSCWLAEACKILLLQLVETKKNTTAVEKLAGAFAQFKQASQDSTNFL